jgi:hypothetical protein
VRQQPRHELCLLAQALPRRRGARPPGELLFNADRSPMPPCAWPTAGAAAFFDEEHIDCPPGTPKSGSQNRNPLNITGGYSCTRPTTRPCNNRLPFNDGSAAFSRVLTAGCRETGGPPDRGVDLDRAGGRRDGHLGDPPVGGELAELLDRQRRERGLGVARVLEGGAGVQVLPSRRDGGRGGG